MLNKILILIIGILLSFELAAQAPEDVEVTVYLIDIEEIDSRTQSFTANLFVSLRWLDPALAHEGPGPKNGPGPMMGGAQNGPGPEMGRL